MDEADDMAAFVPQQLVDQVLALELPGLAYYNDHQVKRETLARMLLSELSLTCTHECATNTVGERLVQLPSARADNNNVNRIDLYLNT